MKLKRIACIALAVMMMAVMAISASAANLTVSQVYTGNTEYTILTNENAASVGAVAAHHVWLDQYKGGSYGYIGTGSAWLYNEGITGEDMTLMNPSSDYDYAYVAYKISADDGNVVENLSISIKGYVNASSGNKHYEVAVFVMDELNADENGRIDLGGMTPALHVGAQTAAVDFRSKAQTADYDCLTNLGETNDVYVVVVPFISWCSTTSNTPSGVDSLRARFAAIDVTATQKQATPVTTEPVTTEPATTEPVVTAPATTEAPATSENTPVPPQGDNAILSALALILVSGLAVTFVARKKR